MQMHVDLCLFMIPLSSLMWPKEYLNMCHIFYNNCSVIFLQHAQKRPQKSFQTKILSVTSSVNYCLITNAIDKRYWNVRLPQGWASSYNRVACLYIIPTKILSISMIVAMQGKFYQYKDNKGTNWPLYGNMQVMLSLEEGAFQCLLSIALVIKQ